MCSADLSRPSEETMPAAFLPPVLEGVQAEVGQLGRFGVAVHPEDAAVCSLGAPGPRIRLGLSSGRERAIGYPPVWWYSCSAFHFQVSR